jgi:hypothetical protein
MKSTSPHILLAQDLRRTAESAWWTALESWQRSRKIAEQSRKAMMKSEGILQWCETFGPRPETNTAEPTAHSGKVLESPKAG